MSIEHKSSPEVHFDQSALLAMSALGHKRSLANICFAPIADIQAMRKSGSGRRAEEADNPADAAVGRQIIEVHPLR